MDKITALFIVIALVVIGGIIMSGKPPSGPNDGWGGSGPVD